MRRSPRGVFLWAAVFLVVSCESDVNSSLVEPVNARKPPSRAVNSLLISADTVTMDVGQTTRMPFRAFDSNGQQVRIASHTLARWSSTDPSVASVDSTGTILATGVGCAAIVVDVGGVLDTGFAIVATATDESLDRTVPETRCPSKLDAVETATLQWTVNFGSHVPLGGTAQISAAAFDADGNKLPERPVTYASSNPEVATISPTGLFTAVGLGGTVISATADGKSISTQIAVVEDTTARRVARVSVSLERSVLVVGDSTQAKVVAFDSAGTAMPVVSAQWSVQSAGSALANVDSRGKIKSVASGSAAVTATVLGVSGSAALTIAIPGSVFPQPEPVSPTPPPGSAADVLALEGPTIRPADVPSSLSWYEANFMKESEAQWAAFGPRWDAGNSISAYERGATYYVWWARTGDTTWKSRAHQLVVNYRNGYLIPAAYGTSPHWSQMESMYLDCIVASDSKSCDAVKLVANKFSAFVHGYLTNVGNPDLEHRIQARVITALWMAEKLAGRGSVYSAQLDAAITQSLSTLNPDGYANLTGTCGGSLNFMGGMLYDVLTRIHDQRPGAYNATIETKAKAFGNYLWSTQWRGTANAADESFNYLSIGCYNSTTGNPYGAGGPTSAPDLNGLILPLFGWLGKTTGDPEWFTRGDQILDGTQSASIYLYRQFSESYSSSFRYLGYRYAQ